jgi:hypothetical protein
MMIKKGGGNWTGAGEWVGVWLDVKPVLWIAYNEQQDRLRPISFRKLLQALLLLMIDLVNICVFYYD